MTGYQQGLGEPLAAVRHTPVTRLLRWGFEQFCNAVFRVYCPLRVAGREQLPEPPFILCSNHSSHADSPALMYASGLGFDHFAMIAAHDYFFESRASVKYLPQLLLNLIPAERRAGRDRILRLLRCCQQYMVDRPRCLILYPEGTRGENADIGSIRRGVGLLAVQLALPVVPAYIHGTHQSLPKGRWWPKSAPVYVGFGAPILPPPLPQRGAVRAYATVSMALEQSLRALREQYMQAVR